MLLAAVLGWLDREHRDEIAFLREENRMLKSQLCGRRLRFDDAQRRRLAVLGQRLGRGVLREVATLVTPDTILRWHRDLVARKWTYVRRRPKGSDRVIGHYAFDVTGKLFSEDEVFRRQLRMGLEHQPQKPQQVSEKGDRRSQHVW
jgi:hypothetical protein